MTVGGGGRYHSVGKTLDDCGGGGGGGDITVWGMMVETRTGQSTGHLLLILSMLVLTSVRHYC